MLSDRKLYFKLTGIGLLTSSVLLMGYYVPRENFTLEMGSFALGWAGLWFFTKENKEDSFLLGLFLRISLFISIPILSDDYFRFLWDGYLTTEGINPFDFKPNELDSTLTNNHFTKKLFDGMNSPNYFSIYPPVNQWVFYLAALTKSTFGGVLVLRSVIIGFEIGTYFIMKNICDRYNINNNKLSWFWLNPLVIIELTGNLHAEGILLFFLLSGLFSLSKLQDFKGGLLLSLSFCSKLFSLIFLPILLLKAGKYRYLKLILGIIPLFLISFSPFLNLSNADHYIESLIFYFKSFEFNGSIFNVVRWIGFQLKGFDVIYIAGPILSLISGIIILFVSWKYRFKNRKVIFTGLTLMISTYLFLSPIVHPWYIIIPLALGLFTNLRFPLIWSGFVFLSYSCYDTSLPIDFKHSMLFLEYLTVFLFLFLDLKNLFKK